MWISTHKIYVYHCFQMYHFLSTFQTTSKRFFNHVLYQGSCHRSSPAYKASICWEFITQFSAAIQPALFFRGVSKCETPISKWAFNCLKIFPPPPFFFKSLLILKCQQFLFENCQFVQRKWNVLHNSSSSNSLKNCVRINLIYSRMFHQQQKL